MIHSDSWSSSKPAWSALRHRGCGKEKWKRLSFGPAHISCCCRVQRVTSHLGRLLCSLKEFLAKGDCKALYNSQQNTHIIIYTCWAMLGWFGMWSHYGRQTVDLVDLCQFMSDQKTDLCRFRCRPVDQRLSIRPSWCSASKILLTINERSPKSNTNYISLDQKMKYVSVWRKVKRSASGIVKLSKLFCN